MKFESILQNNHSCIQIKNEGKLKDFEHALWGKLDLDEALYEAKLSCASGRIESEMFITYSCDGKSIEEKWIEINCDYSSFKTNVSEKIKEFILTLQSNVTIQNVSLEYKIPYKTPHGNSNYIIESKKNISM